VDLLLAPALALLIASVSVAVGERLLTLARLPVVASVRLAVAYSIGTWTVGVAVLVIGLAGWLRAGLLVGLVAGIAALGRWRWAKMRWTGLLAAAPGLLLLGPVALAPPFFYDALVYHLALPWQALIEGAWRAHPENLYAAAPALSQLVATIPLSLGIDRAVAVSHLISFALAGAAVFALARTIGAPRWAAGLAAFSLPLLPGIAAVPALPGATGWAIAAIVSAYAVLLARSSNPGTPALAGFLAGVACAARVQVVPLALALVALTLLRSQGKIRGPAIAAAGLVAGSLPWWLKNLVLLGEPLAPIGWQVGGAAALWRDSVSVVHTAATPVAALATVGRGLEPHLGYVAPLVLAGLLVLVMRRSSRVLTLALAVMLGFVGWMIVGAFPRYLAPTLALALALAAATPRRALGRCTTGAVLGTVAALSVVFSFAEVKRLGGVSLVTDPPAHVRRVWVANDPFPAFAAAEALPPDARVLFVGEPRGYRFPRHYATPSYYDEPVLLEPLERLPDAAAVRAWLTGHGFTHLLVNWGELARLAGRYPAEPFRSPSGRRRWEGLIGLLGPPVIARGGVQIFAVAPH
jgi:hypothetical protein